MHSLALALVLSLFLQAVSADFSRIPPVEVVVNVSDTAVVTCVYPNAINISWTKDGSNIMAGSPGFRVTAFSGPDNSTLELLNTTVAIHNGSYECVAITPAGMAETRRFSVLIVAFLGPVLVELITHPCSEGIIYVHSTITFTCSVSDSKPPILNIAWFRNPEPARAELLPLLNMNINASGRHLNVVDVMSTDVGTYFCHVDNGEISRMSNKIDIQVESLVPRRTLTIESAGHVIVMTDSHDKVLAMKGGQTSLTCVINPHIPAFNPNNFMWKRNTGGLSSGSGGFRLFAHACNSTLFIQNTTEAHIGRYSCGLEGLTMFISLDLARIPQNYRVSVIPDQATLLGEGSTIVFLCDVVPSNEVSNVEESIHWEFSSVTGTTINVIGDGDGRVVLGSRSLTISSLRREDAGTYYCVASHYLVAPIKTRADLAVEDSPSLFISPSSPVVVWLGTSLLLTCSIMSPRPANFSWFIHDRNISSSQRLIISNTDFSSILNITTLEESDLGNISCLASVTLHPTITTTVILNESTQGYLLGNRTELLQFVAEGSRPLLKCPLRAVSSSTTVRWSKGNRELMTVEGEVDIRRGKDGWLLKILTSASLERDNDDVYECNAMDGTFVIHYVITLYITQPVKIVSAPQARINTTEGEAFSITCKATGRPPPKVQWLRGNSFIKDLDDTLIRDFGNGTLHFDKIKNSHSGPYLCFTDTLNGSSPLTRQTTLTVVPAASIGGVFGLNTQEAILIFALVGSICFMILIACLMLIITVFCLSDVSIYGGKYRAAKQASLEEEDGRGFLKQASIRKDNSGILMCPPTVPIFDTLRRSSEEPRDLSFIPSSSNDFTLQTFSYDSNSYHCTSHASSSSLDRGTNFIPAYTISPSHKPVSSLTHTTQASTSIFSSEVEEDLSHFPRNYIELGDCMGQGEFGPVMRAVARNLVPGQAEVKVAVKLLVSETLGEGEGSGFRADLAITDYANQMKLRNRNVAAILGICSDIEPYYIIYEYLDRGDLKHFLHSCRPEDDAPPTISAYQQLRIVMQVADGMHYLFSQHIIHGDIAARNCMVSTHMEVKIGDLGIGHEVYEGDYYDNGAQLLPIRWMPPELLVSSEEGPSFSLHSDIWAFGVFCWEVWSYAWLPYDRYTDEEVLDMVPSGSRLRSPSRSCPSKLYQIMLDCWNENPERRPEFNNICTVLDQLYALAVPTH